VNLDPRILSGNPKGCAYIGINIVTMSGTKTGANVGSKNQGSIHRAPQKEIEFDEFW